MAETFHGYIETTQDVLLIFEGCRRGLIPRVCRRLQEKERRMIRSGSVFVFDERESGIKRWTDGLVWSPSRILGNFLIYRELDKRVQGDKKLSISSSSSNDSRQRSYSADQSVLTSGVMSNDRNRERRLVGSLSDSYRFRKDGLIKKTMSIIVNGVAQHLISYYLPNDIINSKLRTPSSLPELASLEISPDLLVKQNFRIPPMVEPPFDQNESGLTAHNHHGLNSLSSLDNPYSNDRRIHPFRSMSLGSLRSVNNYQNHGNLSAAAAAAAAQAAAASVSTSRPDMNNQLMYTSSTLAQRMDMDDNNHPNKLSNNNNNNNNLSAYYGNQSMYSNNNNNNNQQNGFPPLPSPASMTSSPNTPMLSPVRQSFPHQQVPRHYSMSSGSSGSIQQQQQQQRFGGNRNSFDMIHNNQQQQHHVHPHMIPEVNDYDRSVKMENNETTQQQQQQQQQQQGFSSSPNIGQLLNPVHPLNSNGGVVVKNETTDTNTQQLFQSMGMTNTNTSNYPDYSNSKLPSIPNQQYNPPTTTTTTTSAAATASTTTTTTTGNYGTNNYYIRPNTQSNTIVPMFRNGMAHPQSSTSVYDDAQNGPELGMEPLMLK